LLPVLDSSREAAEIALDLEMADRRVFQDDRE
jgi:hypothetical protein